MSRKIPPFFEAVFAFSRHDHWLFLRFCEWLQPPQSRNSAPSAQLFRKLIGQRLAIRSYGIRIFILDFLIQFFRFLCSAALPVVSCQVESRIGTNLDAIAVPAIAVICNRPAQIIFRLQPVSTSHSHAKQRASGTVCLRIFVDKFIEILRLRNKLTKISAEISEKKWSQSWSFM